MCPCCHSLGCYNQVLQTGGLNSRHGFLTVLKAGKSKVKVLLSDSVSGESLSPGLQIGVF